MLTLLVIFAKEADRWLTDFEEGIDVSFAVGVSQFAYDPPTIEVPVGARVTWTNHDSAPHTVTSDDRSFDSGRLNQGDQYTFAFDRPGSYSYHCDLHPDMKGTVVVVEDE